MHDDHDSQSEQVRGRKHWRGDSHDSYSRKSGGDSNGMYKRILEALIVLAVAALIGAVWNLTQTATLLQSTQDAMRRDIERIERRQDSLEGKITRGGPDGLSN